MDNFHLTVFYFSLYLSSLWLSQFASPNGLLPVRTVLDMPTVYLGLLPVCFSEWRMRHYWCGADFPSRVYSRKGSANHSSKPKAQKNKLVFLLRFCLTSLSSRFVSKSLLNNSPPNSQTQQQTCLPLHPHT